MHLFSDDAHNNLLKALQVDLTAVEMIKPLTNPSARGLWAVRTADILQFYDEKQHMSFHKSFKKEFGNSPTVTMEQFARFLSARFPETGTRCRGHVFVKFYVALYNLRHTCGMPHFVGLPKEVQPRAESLLVYGVNRFLDDHEFFSQHKERLGMAFNAPIGLVKTRYFDVAFLRVKVVVEVQEDGNNHVDNANDEFKYSVARIANYRVLYFDIAKLHGEGMVYWTEFIRELEKTLLESLLAADPDFRDAFYLYQFEQISRKELTTVMGVLSSPFVTEHPAMVEALEEKAMMYYNVVNNPEGHMVKRLYEARNGKLLTISEVAAFVRMDEATVTKDIYECGIATFVRDGDSYAVRMDWPKLVWYLSDTSLVNSQDKQTLQCYLAHIEMIFREVLTCIDNDVRERELVRENSILALESHVREDACKAYTKQIQDLDKKVDVLTDEMGIYKKKAQRMIRLGRSLLDKTSGGNARTRTSASEMEAIVKGMEELVVKHAASDITVRISLKEPIFGGMPDFPILFSDDYLDFLPRRHFESICNAFNVPERKRTEVVRLLARPISFNLSSISRVENVPAVIIAPAWRDRYTEMKIPKRLPETKDPVERRRIFVAETAEILAKCKAAAAEARKRFSIAQEIEVSAADKDIPESEMSEMSEEDLSDFE